MAVTSIEELKRLQQQRFSPYEQPFVWKAEYLPYIVGALGIVGAVIVYKRYGKKRKRRR